MPSSQPSQQRLLDEVEALRSEVKELRHQLDTQRPTTRPATEETALPSTAPSLQAAQNDLLSDAQRRTHFADVTGITAAYVPDQGVQIRSEDGNFLVHPWAFAQFRNTTVYRQYATATSSDVENGFEVPRAKIVLDGHVVSPDLTYQFIWATSDTTGNLGLQDAWARYHLPNTPFAFRAGQIRNPVDHEQIMYATRSLTPDRSIVNNVLLNGDDVVKGASMGIGYDTNWPVRTEIGVTSGERNFDTTFQPFPTNAANWGLAGRIEWKLTGRWGDYSQFTALGDKEPLLVLGAGADYTEAGDTGQFTHVADAQFDLPAGLTLYGAYLGRYVRHNGGNPSSNGQFTGPGPFANTYDSTVRVMAGWLFEQRFEPFVRYEYLHFDGRELPAGSHDLVHDITLGFNYYFFGHRAKITTGISYLPEGSPVSSGLGDVLPSHGGNELVVQAQFQLII